MSLSKYFDLSELTVSETAARRGMKNVPGGQQLENLKATAARMDEVREGLGSPIIVTSGYRSPELNAAIGGSKTSAHCHGLAVDFTCPRYGNPLAVAKAVLASGIEFDQLIHEYGTWVHIGFAAPGKPSRRQLLTINKRGTVEGL
jgi:zinc D-Ala-D-Ala carboxypeptidase